MYLKTHIVLNACEDLENILLLVLLLLCVVKNVLNPQLVKSFWIMSCYFVPNRALLLFPNKSFIEKLKTKMFRCKLWQMPNERIFPETISAAKVTIVQTRLLKQTEHFYLVTSVEICQQHAVLAVQTGTNWSVNVMLMCLLCKRHREGETWR